jgi:hypothetical protein
MLLPLLRIVFRMSTPWSRQPAGLRSHGDSYSYAEIEACRRERSRAAEVHALELVEQPPLLGSEQALELFAPGSDFTVEAPGHGLERLVEMVLEHVEPPRSGGFEIMFDLMARRQDLSEVETLGITPSGVS